jgi:Secretion system C-terminal sorting domain/Fibronectin type III domain
MKKGLFVALIIVISMAAFASQMYVVGEVFSQTWSEYCLEARTGIGDLYETQDFVVPLIWEGDGEHPSPQYSQREAVYGVGGLPHAQFQGSSDVIGSGTNMLPAYTTQYNNFINIDSPFLIDLEMNVVGTDLELTVNVEVTGTVTTTDLNKLLFLLSYDYGTDYSCSVQRYEEFDFNLTAIGEEDTFVTTFTIDSDWDLANVRGIALIQKMDGAIGNYPIHQAAITDCPLSAPNPIANQEMGLNETLIFDLTDFFYYQGAPVPAALSVQSSDQTIVDAELDGTDLNITSFDNGGNVQINIMGEHAGHNSISTFFVYVVNPSDHYIVILDLDPTSTGATLKATIENNYFMGDVFVTNDITVYQLDDRADAVFVLLGVNDNNYVLTETEAELMTSYLDNGGNIYMEGGDTWYYDSPTSVHSYFNIDGLSDGSGDLGTITGSEFLSNMNWFYTGDNNYLDHLAPIGNAFVIFSNFSPEYDCGVAYDSGSYRTIGTSFEITGLSDANNTLDDAVSGIIDFFGIDAIPQLPPANLEVISNVPEDFATFTWEAPIVEDITGYDVYLDSVMQGNTIAMEWIFSDLEIGTLYEAGVVAIYDTGSSTMATLEFTFEETDAGNNLIVITELKNNYPNPFNPTTNIAFSIDEATHVTLEIYNVKGEKVKTLVDRELPADIHNRIWNGADANNRPVTSGVYFYKLKAGSFIETKKMILLK